MLKGVSEALEVNTRLRKKRHEKEIRRSRLKARTPVKPYDVASGNTVSNTTGKAARRVSGATEKEPAKPLDSKPMSVEPAPRRSRQNPVSKDKGREVATTPIEDNMNVDSSIIVGDVSMNEDSWSKVMGKKSNLPPSDSQSSAKMMPPPPVPLKALKQSLNQKSPLKPTPLEATNQPPPPSPSLTQSNPSRRRLLGMTRIATQTSAVSHSTLPAKRKQFKSPLIKQEPDLSQPGGPPRSQSRVYPVPPPSTCSQPVHPTQKPAPPNHTPKPPKLKSEPLEVIDITDDPDTSYDFSTSSIDGDEINKVMEEYDRGTW